MSNIFSVIKEKKVFGVYVVLDRRSDSNQNSDYIAILFFFDFKFCVIKVENIKPVLR